MMLNVAGLGAYYGAVLQDTPTGGVQLVNAYSGAAVPWWCSIWTFSDACHPTGTMPVSKPLPPVAPQTEGQMTVPGAWTPAEASAWTAYVQGQVRSAEQNVYETAGADQAGVSSTAVPESGSNTNLIVALAVAGVGLGLLFALKR